MSVSSLLPVLPVIVGVLVAGVGVAGLTGRLPRNRFAGVRTAASMRDDEAFRVANRVAGLPMAVAGLIAVVAGVAAFALSGTAATVTVVLIGLAGLAVITLGAGMLGHRAALAVPEPKRPLPAGCKGCACGGCG